MFKRSMRSLAMLGSSIALLIASALPAAALTTIGANISTDGILTVGTGASGFVFGTGVNATTFSSGATAARAISFPDLAGTVALNTNKLSAFAATTSAELAGVLTNETGTGTFVLATGPSLVGFTATGNVFLSNATIMDVAPLSFEGVTVDAFDLSFIITDPTVNRTITFPDATGTICLTTTCLTAASALNGANLTAGTVLATKLQAAAADLGAANVIVNLGNSNGSFNTSLTLDGTLTIGDTLSSGSATVSLLASPTTINFGDAATALNLGSTSGTLSLKNAVVQIDGSIGSVSTGNGIGSNIFFNKTNAHLIGLIDENTVNSTVANSLTISGGNKVAGTGNGGNLILNGGTSSGGTAGQVLIGNLGSAVTINAPLSLNATTLKLDADNTGVTAVVQISSSGAATPPALRYTGGSGTWQASNDGTIYGNVVIDGVTTITAANLADGSVTAKKLQATAADLGAADVTVNLSNTNSTFNTNLTIDGNVQIFGSGTNALQLGGATPPVHLASFQQTAPSGAGGTAGTATLLPGSTDTKGQLTVTPSQAGTVEITFNVQYQTRAPICVIGPASDNAASSAQQVFATSTQQKLTLTFVAPVTQAQTWNYICVE